MFCEDNYSYEKITKEEYEDLLDLYEGDKKITAFICNFYKDKKGELHKLYNLETPKTEWILLSKYYIISLELESDVYFINEKVISIINLGYFIVKGPLKQNIKDDRDMFIKYDNNFVNLVFDLNDEEFLEKYNNKNELKIYKNGEVLHWNVSLFEKYFNSYKAVFDSSMFQYVVLYAYKGKKIEYFMSEKFDEMIKLNIQNDLIVNRELNRILKERCAEIGVLYKKNNDKYHLIKKIGF